METFSLGGKEVRDEVLAQLKAKVARAGRPPGLGVILAGDDPASAVYVRSKTKACDKVGFHHRTFRFDSDVAPSQIFSCLEQLNADEQIDGILVQLPLPPQVPEKAVIQAIDPRKDVDGFHPENLGLLVAGHPRFVPCTPKGILRLLQYHGVQVAGRRVAVVGRSVIVGRTLGLLLSLKRDDANATVTLCHSGTVDLAATTRGADIVIAAIGKPEALGRDHIAEGAVVVDVGINRIADPEAKRGYRLAGDVQAAALEGWASALTPVPGGVGPMTIAMLLENTWEALAGQDRS